MMIIRPIERRDLADLLTLAGKSGIGLTSPQNEDTLSARIERALKTWQGELPQSDQCYLFVLEDSERRQAVGVCAIEVAVGLAEPWYSFRVGTQVHASKQLNVYKSVPTLFLSNDHTGHSSCARCSSIRIIVTARTASCCRRCVSCLLPRSASVSHGA